MFIGKTRLNEIPSHTIYGSFPCSSEKVHPTPSIALQVVVRKLAGKGHSGSLVHLLPVLLKEGLVDLCGGGSKSRSSNKFLG
jgi:hypothetical protein